MLEVLDWAWSPAVAAWKNEMKTNEMKANAAQPRRARFMGPQALIHYAIAGRQRRTKILLGCSARIGIPRF
jgi:hypothetical protein